VADGQPGTNFLAQHEFRRPIVFVIDCAGNSWAARVSIHNVIGLNTIGNILSHANARARALAGWLKPTDIAKRH